MKKIQTDSRYYYTNNIEVFTIPPFSEIKKVYINGSNIYIIYEFPIDMEFHDQKKIVNLKVQEFVSAFSESGYQYLDTQIIQKTELQNSSFSNNIEINIVNIDIIYHFFIQENKPQIEMRNDKINDIIN
jgi:hypothetical protein